MGGTWTRAAGPVAAVSLLAGCYSASAPAARRAVAPSVPRTLVSSARPPLVTPRPSLSRPPTPRATGASGDLATWSLQRLAAQIIVVPVRESDVSLRTSEVAMGVGGVILFGSSAPDDLASALRRLESVAPGGIRPLVMSDEEGGAIQRMANVVGVLPSARSMGATLSAIAIRRLAADAGRRMRAAGVTVDLAPVLDLDGGAGPSAADVIGSRSFSTLPSVAAADGLAFAAGLRDAGVVPVVKHFPGLGGASANTDVAGATTLPWSSLAAAGLLPFRAAVRARVPALMVSNASVPGLTSLPASLSYAATTGVLRRQLGFRGLVITDSLSAGVISASGFSVPSATVAALSAGADMVMFNSDTAATRDVHTVLSATVAAVVRAVAAGRLLRARLVDAVRHVLAVKQSLGG